MSWALAFRHCSCHSVAHVFRSSGFAGRRPRISPPQPECRASVARIGDGRIRLQSELATGRLQILQAQIEPHFLFNSLANVRRLLRINGPAGRAMLGDLLRYLQIALPRMRADESTLAREVELVRAFLAVHQVRMGPRLRVLFDVPSELEARSVPPMMLLTLVENSIKHGVGPLPEGGTITIAGAQTAAGLELAVTDTGRGIVAGSGHGVGLANTRARLRSMYGPQTSCRFASMNRVACRRSSCCRGRRDWPAPERRLARAAARPARQWVREASASFGWKHLASAALASFLFAVFNPGGGTLRSSCHRANPSFLSFISIWSSSASRLSAGICGDRRGPRGRNGIHPVAAYSAATAFVAVLWPLAGLGIAEWAGWWRSEPVL